MELLFPQNPLMRKLPEPLFEPEYDAAQSLGFHCLLFDEEALCTGDIDLALKRLPLADGVKLLYRGWILTEEQYGRFEAALLARGYTLVSSAAQYAEVSYFPNYYPKIRELSPAAVWTDKPDSFLAWSLARRLGDGPFVIKDHIKSAKHLWHEACFIPKGSGWENFERIADNLKREQGKTFFRGFVVKEYVPLQSRGESPKAYPMCEEYRLFFWNRQLLIASHYHRLSEQSVDWSGFIQLGQRFDAPFFTMDVAQTESGNWIVVDMGAGECSSLPPSLEPKRFYSRLASATGSE
ncbi:MAG TPA: ATP-grasp domain-containing protein [Gemmataceae bacterium]|nr:ATP-grasp domain-containing protein [Gemmataceae bacterium]